MSRTLTISDNLYAQLEVAARVRGLGSVEQLLDTWQFSEDNVHHRQETVRQIDALRNRLFKKYGEMADSVELIRDDRGR
ncbi:hypothetical protein IH992_16860 [Candidatus Poribacteria bacterium]|nr:hypothetical protein [Candidatus Poribacteria bacterium]